MDRDMGEKKSKWPHLRGIKSTFFPQLKLLKYKSTFTISYLDEYTRYKDQWTLILVV